MTAAEARHLVSHALQRASAAVAERALVDALLVATELFTNAQRHGGGLVDFTVRVVRGHLELSVEDGNVLVPATAAARAPDAPGGYGWPLVQRLARTVDVAVTATGKTIRVTLPL
ncbi:ATP-binding protein [Streptomyces sp. NPDC048650]|uniref:ATP-binding protein n=1 Tax=unclassified Streptomyces TaxID=2593676 RepID=UPI003713C495